MTVLKSAILAILLLLVFSVGCSSRDLNQVTLPENNPDYTLPIPDTGTLPDGHSPLGFWNLSFDPFSLNVEVSQDRNLSAHYNLTAMLPPSIRINSYNPTSGILDVDVTINNQYPINGYDLRLIIFTDSAGHFLENWDDFTNLYDIAGGNIINPFKAYAKTETNRIFAAYTQHTENLKIYIPAGDFNVRLAIDACFPSNCTEPYSIDNFTQGTLKPTAGSSAPVSVDVSDWQNNVSAVYLYCPFITGGPLVTLSHDSGNMWSGTLINNAGIGTGQYTGYIVAFSGPNALYDLVVIQISSSEPQFQKVLTWGGEYYETLYGFASDSANNIYLGGSFYMTVDFDPGTGVEEITSVGQQDAYILKLNSDEEFIWVQTIGNLYDVYVRNLFIHNNEYLYALGAFYGTTDFDPGPGSDVHTPAGWFDSFISKYDLDGNWIWTKTFGGGGFDQAVSLVTDSEGDMYITGLFDGTTDLDPGSGTYNISSMGFRDNFILKLDSDGIFQWAHAFGSSGEEAPLSIYLKDTNSIVTAGDFGGTLDFDPGAGVQNRTPVGSIATYILNLDLNGNYIDVQVYGSDVYCLTLRFEQDSAYGYLITGYFDGSMDFDPGAGEDIRVSDEFQSAYICRYDTALNYQMAYDMGNPTGEPFIYDAVFTDDGAIIFGGQYYGLVDINPGPGEYWLNETFDYNLDAFLGKLDSDGNISWAKSWGGSDSDDVFDIKLNYDDSIYAMGHFFATADFDPGDGVVERTSYGQNDAYISVFE